MTPQHAEGSELARANERLQAEIRERESAELALRREKAHFERLFEASPEAIAIIDETGLVLRVNREFTRLFGYEPDKIVGRSVDEVIASPEHAQEARAITLRVASGETVSAEGIRRTKDGRSITASILAAPILVEEGRSAAYAIYRDITEQKRAEEALLDIARGVSAETGESFFRELVRHLAKALRADYSLVAELAGEAVDRMRTISVYADGVIVEESNEYALAGTPYERVLAGETVLYPTGVQEQFPHDAQLADMGVTACAGAPLRDSEGQVCGLAGVLYRQAMPDVHLVSSMLEIFAARASAELERTRAEQDRERLELEVRHLQKLESVGQLAGGVAHDFNNLLQPILTYAEMLGAEFSPDDPRHNDVEQVYRAAQRARILTQQLLAFSRKQELEMSTVRLGQVVEDFQHILRRTIRENIEIEIRVEESAGHVRGDISQIEIVLVNLAVNAQDAMKDGGKIVLEVRDVMLDEAFVSSHPSLETGPHVLLSMRDTGVGMDSETRARLFEPFFTTKERGKGTGLGLATVYGIVKQHGGGILVDSQPGQGTTFLVYFPQTGPVEVTDGEMPDKRDVTRGTETVLVVEDDELVREPVCSLLEQYGYDVISAGSGEEAITLASRYPGTIHLLLTDVVLPEMNGRELYRALIKSIPNLAVLYMSGYAGDVIAGRGALDESLDFLQKPFSLDTLTTRMREVLDD